MTKKFKPTCPWIKKERAAEKRALNSWYRLKNAVGDPGFATSIQPYGGAKLRKIYQKHNDLVLYAAALGQKRGLLPADLTNWSGVANWAGDDGVVTFRQISGNVDFKNYGKAVTYLKTAGEPVKIELANLEWTPEPIELEAAA